MADLANEVQELLAGLTPEAASVVARMIVAEGVAHDMPSDIAKQYLDFQASKNEAMKRSVLRSYISKREAGEDVSGVVALATVIGKAAGFDGPGQFDEKKHRRGAGGRFTTMNHKVRYSRDPEPMDDEDEGNLGIVYPSDKSGNSIAPKLSDAQRSQYQQAYTQISSALRNQRGAGNVGNLVVRYSDGSETSAPVPNSDEPFTLRGDKKVLSARVEISPQNYGSQVGGPGATFNAINALTSNPEFAAHVASGKYGQHLQPNDWSQRQGEEFSSGAGFRRLQHGSDLLNSAFAPFLPGSAAGALSVASFVGQYGPQAQQVFGPTVDRAKYRYKGTERKLDPALGESVRSLRKVSPNSDSYRKQLIYGKIVTGRGGMTAREPSPVMNYMRGLLPSKSLSALQRFSGHQPPSQGILINDKGKIVSQMVGNGEDWYLPFDLNKLGQLQGGEYVRTRAQGGLTTEDIYTGLMAGARSMTVVSRDGIHTLEFDDALRGSRRYGSTSREMTERYGKLLDAVKNGQVTVNDVDPSRKSELRANSGGDQELYSRLLAGDRANPQPSSEMLDGYLDDFLEQQAARVQTPDAREFTKSELTAQLIKNAAKERAAQDNRFLGGDVYGPSDKESEIYDELDENPRALVSLMPENMRESFGRYQEKQIDNYQESLKPLTLNGGGYDYAMQALHEQFPYFIKKTTYQPWDQNREDGQDRGYVKPKFVRPEGSKAGYFDRSVNGYTKVSADKTRYQNYGVMRRLGESHEGSQGRSSDRERPGRTEVATAAPQTAAPTAAPATDKQRAAALALGKHLLRDQNIGAGAIIPSVPNPPHGQSFQSHRDHSSQWMQKVPELAPLLIKPEDLDGMSDADLQKNVGAMLKASQDMNLFDTTDSNLVSAFSRNGEAPPKTAYNDTHATSNAVLGEVNYDFGKDFEPGKSRAMYQYTFGQDPDIMNVAGDFLAHKGEDMPELGADDFQDEMDDYIDAIQDNPDTEQLGLIRGAVKAKQLNQAFNTTPDDPGPTRSFIFPPTTPTKPKATGSTASPFGRASGGAMGRLVPYSLN